MPNLPSIVITPVAPIATVDPHCQTTSRSLAQQRDIWSDFLSLKISANTQRAYCKAIADFYQRVYRDYAILRLLWDNALRRGEVCSLDVGDFSTSEQKLMILGKGKIAKISIDLSSGARAAISHWLELRGSCSSDDPMFISLSRNQPGHRLGGSAIYAIVRQYCQEQEIEKMMSPHRIRHSAITAHLNTSEGNIRAAQALSRHADIKTLTLYDDNRHQHQKGATDLLGSLLDE